MLTGFSPRHKVHAVSGQAVRPRPDDGCAASFAISGFRGLASPMKARYSCSRRSRAVVGNQFSVTRRRRSVEVAEAAGADELVSGYYASHEAQIMPIVRRRPRVFMPLTVGAASEGSTTSGSSTPAATRSASTLRGDGNSSARRQFGRQHRGEHRPRRVQRRSRGVGGAYQRRPRADGAGSRPLKEVERLGAGETVLTSWTPTAQERFYEITAAVSGRFRFRWWQRRRDSPPTADAILLSADAALAASIFHFGEYDPRNQGNHGARRIVAIARGQDGGYRTSHSNFRNRFADRSMHPMAENEVDKYFRVLVKFEGSDLHLKADIPVYSRQRFVRPIEHPIAKKMKQMLMGMMNERNRNIFERTAGPTSLTRSSATASLAVRINLLQQLAPWVGAASTTDSQLRGLFLPR